VLGGEAPSQKLEVWGSEAPPGKKGGALGGGALPRKIKNNFRNEPEQNVTKI